MLRYTLTAFADEISPDLTVQLDTLARHDIRYVEFRGVWGKNVLDLDGEEVHHVAQGMAARGFRVSAIASPIGKIRIDDDFDAHLQRFQRALELTAMFQTPYIRIFSFYLPQDQPAAEFRSEVLRRIGILCDRAAAFDRSIVLLHENEKEIYGDTGERCRDLIETLDRPNLQATFDPANFIQVKVRPFTDAYPVLARHVRYLHIKDAAWDDGHVVPAGAGDGQLSEVLSALSTVDFLGFLSLEPHLAVAGRHAGYSGEGLFGQAVTALKTLLSDSSRYRAEGV